MIKINQNTILNDNDLRKLDIPEPWKFGMADCTRFGELDALGHVNNTAYLRWLENLRVNYFRHFDIANYDGIPPRLVLKTIGMEYKKEMGLHEPYVVTGRTSAFRNSSFTMEYAVYAGDLRATGFALLVWLDQEGQKISLPDHVREFFLKHDQASDDR